MGSSAHEHCGASSEHSDVGLNEVAEVDEAHAGEKTDYSKSRHQGSLGEGTAVDMGVATGGGMPGTCPTRFEIPGGCPPQKL